MSEARLPSKTIRFLSGFSVLLIVYLNLCGCHSDPETESGVSFRFEGSISAEVLDNFLNRAVSHQILFTDHDPVLLMDDIRMFCETSAKFIGRAAIIWDTPQAIEPFFESRATIAGQVHAADPEIILQGGLFETIDTLINRIMIPAWVFDDFGIAPQNRPFSYNSTLYPDGRYRDFWQPGASVPDISRLETRLWYYYCARRFIDCGFEAIHFGVVEIVADNDPDFEAYADLLNRIRQYARLHARRKLVLCDAHLNTGIFRNGHSLFDFLSYPLRIEEIAGQPPQGQLIMGHDDSIYGRTRGGITPSGWTAERLPYLVEIDNWGSSGQGGQNIGGIWIWGWDEIDWFARLTETERNHWLIYAYNWIKTNDPCGHFQLPTRRILADPIDGIYYWYYANNASAACQLGFNQEATIRTIFNQHDD